MTSVRNKATPAIIWRNQENIRRKMTSNQPEDDGTWNGIYWQLLLRSVPTGQFEGRPLFFSLKWQIVRCIPFFFSHSWLVSRFSNPILRRRQSPESWHSFFHYEGFCCCEESGRMLEILKRFRTVSHPLLHLGPVSCYSVLGKWKWLVFGGAFVSWEYLPFRRDKYLQVKVQVELRESIEVGVSL